MAVQLAIAAVGVIGICAFSSGLEKTRHDNYAIQQKHTEMNESAARALSGKQPLTSFCSALVNRQDAKNNEFLSTQELVKMNGLFGKTKYAYMNKDSPYCGVGEMYREPFAI